MSLLRDANNNLSSKRVAGYVVLAVVLIAFVGDLFEKIEINESVANTLIMSAAALLGIGTFERLKRSTNASK
jgi:hypothetical protein